MLPIREATPRIASRADAGGPGRRAPALVVWTLVLSNVAAFLAEQWMVLEGDASFPYTLGFVPRILTRSDPAHGVLTIFTSMFLHGGWFHLLGNLWFLWFFGRSVEEALGRLRFVVLYLVGGVAAALAQAAVDPGSGIPMMGASGAIGAVLAAYVSLFPRRRIVTAVPIFFFPILVQIPAFLFVVEWFAINLLRGLGALHQAAQGGVAWWAHVGGFLSGLVLVRALFPRRQAPRRHGEEDDDDEPSPASGHPGPRTIVVRGPDGRRYVTHTNGWDA